MRLNLRGMAEIAGGLLACAAQLARLLPVYVYRRRRGASAFGKQLEQLGIRGPHAKELTEIYLELGDVQKLIHTVKRHRS